MRKTRQREAILEFLMDTKTHPTVEEIYRNVKRKLPRVSMATVYRNLHQLAEAGLVREIRVPGEKSSRFDGDTSPHYHFKCRVCGRVLDLDVPALEGMNQLVAMATGHRVEDHTLIFFGVCKDCLRMETEGGGPDNM